MSDDLGLLLIAFGSTAALVVGIWVKGSWARWQAAKRMRALPRTKIRDLVDGQRVRIVGTARSLGELTTGVFSGTPCLATTAGSAASGRNAMNVPQPEDRSVAFRVEDDTGAVDVDAVGATLSIAGSESIDLAASQAFGASIIGREGASGARRMRYFESRLAPDEQVAVLGTVARDAAGGLRLARPVELSTHADALAA